MLNFLDKYGLHKRLILSLLPVVLVTSGSVLALLVQDADRRVSNIKIEYAKQQVQTLAEGSLDTIITEEYDLLSRWTGAVIRSQDFAYASIVRIDGKILTHSNVDSVGATADYIATSTSYSIRDATYLGRPIQLSTYPIRVGHNFFANAHVAYYIDTEIALDKQTIIHLTGIVFLLFGMLSIGSYFVTREVIKPLDQLNKAITGYDVQLNDFNVDKNLLSRSDEVGKLAKAFRGMDSRIVKYVSKIKHEVEERVRAESENKIKSAFLANMSHELRTPLNAILGYSELIIDYIPEKDSTLKGDVNNIHSSGTHLLSLISAILDLSKIESGKMELDNKACNMSKVINDVIVNIQPQLNNNNNNLNLQISSNVGDGCFDPTKIQQVLLNLLSNACKFTKNGAVDLIADIKNIHHVAYYEIEVRDQGIGMTEEQCMKIFNPYTQAESSTTQKFGGTGLGLTISKKLCELMGGDITVSSINGVGSTFTALIPVFPSTEAESA